jgi:phosphoribosyl-ATP pyrophosphohydrolase
MTSELSPLQHRLNNRTGEPENYDPTAELTSEQNNRIASRVGKEAIHAFMPEVHKSPSQPEDQLNK